MTIAFLNEAKTMQPVLFEPCLPLVVILKPLYLKKLHCFE